MEKHKLDFSSSKYLRVMGVDDGDVSNIKIYFCLTLANYKVEMMEQNYNGRG